MDDFPRLVRIPFRRHLRKFLKLVRGEIEYPALRCLRPRRWIHILWKLSATEFERRGDD